MFRFKNLKNIMNKFNYKYFFIKFFLFLILLILFLLVISVFVKKIKSNYYYKTAEISILKNGCSNSFEYLKKAMYLNPNISTYYLNFFYCSYFDSQNFLKSYNFTNKNIEEPIKYISTFYNYNIFSKNNYILNFTKLNKFQKNFTNNCQNNVNDKNYNKNKIKFFGKRCNTFKNLHQISKNTIIFDNGLKLNYLDIKFHRDALRVMELLISKNLINETDIIYILNYSGILKSLYHNDLGLLIDIYSLEKVINNTQDSPQIKNLLQKKIISTQNMILLLRPDIYDWHPKLID